jgi:polysaccharide pyruvyl transferase WcaK-like protein
MNEVGSLFIVGGGGLLMKGDGFDTVSGWQFNIELSTLSELKIPLIIYGIGYNRFEGDPEFSEDTINHIKATKKKSTLFSVRDKGTRTELEKLGIVEVSVIPDAAMFCDSIKIALPGIEPDDFCIGLNWAGDREDQRFPNKDKSKVIKELCNNLLRFSRQYKQVKVVMIPHVSKYDHKIAWVFKEYLGDIFYDLATGVPWLYPETLINVPFLAGIYRRMDIVIGMRGHANIIPFGQGTRTIAFGDHIKNQFFAQQISAPCIKNDCQGLLDVLCNLDRHFPELKMDAKREYLRNVFLNFNRKIIEILNNY